MQINENLTKKSKLLCFLRRFFYVFRNLFSVKREQKKIEQHKGYYQTIGKLKDIKDIEDWETLEKYLSNFDLKSIYENQYMTWKILIFLSHKLQVFYKGKNAETNK